MQDEDRGLGKVAAQREPLLRMGDEKAADAVLPQRCGDLPGAEAVAVRLDHRGDLTARGLAPEAPVVLDQSAEIDGQNGLRRLSSHSRRGRETRNC